MFWGFFKHKVSDVCDVQKQDTGEKNVNNRVGSWVFYRFEGIVKDKKNYQYDIDIQLFFHVYILLAEINVF